MAKPKTPKRPSKSGSAEGETYVAPSVRVFTDWSPSKLRAAHVQAEGGNLMQAVAVCDWIFTDDAVDAGCDSLCDALFGLVPTFEPSGDKRRSNRPVKALEAGEDFWKGYPEAELRLMLRWGYVLGLSLHRHGWEAFADHGNRLLPMLGFWHAGTLAQNLQTQEWTVSDHRNQKHVVVAGDGEWVMHTPFGRSRPWAMGKWLSLRYWVLLKHYARLDWARHGEKAATLVATSSKDNTDKQRRELCKDLQDSGSDRIVALQVGFDLKMVEVTANTRQIYEAQINAANSAIAIVLRGGNLTTRIEGHGAQGAAETQAKHGEEPKLRFNAESISTTLHDQSLSIWALFNYGDRALAPWPVYPVEPEEDLKASADTINTLGDGVKKLDELGFIIDEDVLIERFRLDFVSGRKSPEERAKEAADRAAAAGLPAGGAPAQPAPGKTPAPAKDAKPKAGARGTFAAHLASGTPVSEARGFVAGQMYADDLVESAAAAGVEALEPTITAIAEAIEASTGYEDLRERLRALYPTLDNTELQELMYRAMLLGELAGRHAVNRDN